MTQTDPATLPVVVLHTEGGVIHAVHVTHPLRVISVDDDVEDQDDSLVTPSPQGAPSVWREEQISPGSRLAGAFAQAAGVAVDPEVPVVVVEAQGLVVHASFSTAPARVIVSDEDTEGVNRVVTLAGGQQVALSVQPCIVNPGLVRAYEAARPGGTG